VTPLAVTPSTGGLDRAARSDARPWQILCGLVVSGFLLALPGGLLPLWGYHIHPDFGIAGNYFLALGAGVISGGMLALRLARKTPLHRLLAAGYFVAALALALLSAAAPPAQVWYQMLALLVTGAGAGIMNTAVLEAMTSCHDSDPANITLTGGIFFGAGSVLAAILLAQSFGEAMSATRLLLIAALAAAVAGALFGRVHVARRVLPELSVAQSIEDLRSPLAILFALLLFFQFGNEWSLAGWLPVFLIDRMGLSPATAVSLLALYWLALMVGRFVVSKLLKVVRHGRLMAVSAFCALFGCTALLAAGSRFGVISGLLLTGVGFSAIYPLVAERIASRFSYYHPGYFNGIFTFALLGGILAPFLLGHLAAGAGLNVIPLAAMLGSCAVFALVMLIWLGHKVSGH
jgi:FHS family glucose/mannose:H+ symporter-like MFS transporter